MSKSKDKKRRVLKAQQSMIKVYMSIFNVSREDAIAALEARGLLSSDSKKEKK